MRPKALDAAAMDRVIDATRKGLTRAVAAGLAGVAETTLYRHLREDVQFRQRVKEAQREGEEKLIELIRAAATIPKHWTAAAWLLERRYPDRYGPPKQRLQHEVQLSEEQARAKYRELTGQDWPGGK